ncbi:MAG: RraA family protein [Myxococcota bacterium]
MNNIAQSIMNGFPKLSTGNIADAGRSDVKIMDFGIKPLHYSMRAAGPAFTIEVPPAANLSLHEALTLAPPGSVLVFNAHGNMTSGHMGDLMALACQVRGIAGVVVDGAVRDVDDIIAMGFPVFARGSVPHGNAAQTGEMNKPIKCGGIDINPGDMIFADSTGVLAFPAAKAKAIYEQAVKIANSELGFVQKLNEGKTLLQIPEFLKLHSIDPAVLKHDGVKLD